MMSKTIYSLTHGWWGGWWFPPLWCPSLWQWHIPLSQLATSWAPVHVQSSAVEHDVVWRLCLKFRSDMELPACKNNDSLVALSESLSARRYIDWGVLRPSLSPKNSSQMERSPLLVKGSKSRPILGAHGFWAGWIFIVSHRPWQETSEGLSLTAASYDKQVYRGMPTLLIQRKPEAVILVRYSVSKWKFQIWMAIHNESYNESHLKSSFRKFYGRYNDLVCDYKLCWMTCFIQYVRLSFPYWLDDG
jgi:hypothetical protein